jgi:hypothetical protein
VLAVCEVTTLFGGTAATMEFEYENQSGTTGQTTGANPVRSTAAIVTMLQPSMSGAASNNIPWNPLASGDYGMKTLNDVIMGGTAMSTGAGCFYVYYPLLWMPGLAANMYIERDSTTQIDGIIALAQDSSYYSGCLGVFIEANTTNSGAFNSFMRSCVG